MNNYTKTRIADMALASGRAAYGSPEMAALLPLFVEYLRLKHGIKLVLIKVWEDTASSASASTHVGGWAVDVRSWNLTAEQRRTVIYEATKYGIPIYYRTAADGFDPHFHGMVNAGRLTPCSYQIDSMRNGRNGLRNNAIDRDKALRPAQSAWLSYGSAVAALRAEIAGLKTPAPSNDIEEFIMSLSPEAKKAFINEVALAVWNMQVTAGGKKAVITAVAESNVRDAAQSDALVRISAQLSALASKQGVPVDQKAIVAGVVAGITDKLEGAVNAAVKMHLPDIDSDELDSIAVAVVDELASRIAA